MPAPMTMQSNFSTMGKSPSAGEPVARVRRQARPERFRQRRQKANGAGRHGEMSEAENRRVAVGVDRDDQIGALDAHPMLDRAGNSRGEIELRPDRLAGL